MIVFENEGEIDPRLISLIGVNVKETSSPIGYFGTGLKYAIACMTRWGEEIRVQSGLAEFGFVASEVSIRGQQFGLISMCGQRDRAELGFTTDLGKHWEPWMVYRELWSNAIDEPEGRVYEAGAKPRSHAGVTRVIVSGTRIESAHARRSEFLLDRARPPLHVVPGLEIFPGPSRRIFYRGIAVQGLDKPGIYTDNITEEMHLSEDRTAGSWSTDPIIARGLAAVQSMSVIDSTLLASKDKMESRLDYDYVYSPSEKWLAQAKLATESRPLDVPKSVRSKFVHEEIKTCPSCGKPL